MKVLYTSDVHGNRWIYERLFALAEEEAPGALVLGGDLTLLTPPLDHMMKAQRECWLEFLRPRCEKLRARGTRVLLIPGNDDLRANDDALAQGAREGAWEHLDGKVATLDGYAILGCGDINVTPFILKDRERWDAERGVARHRDVTRLDAEPLILTAERDEGDLHRTLREHLDALFAQVPDGARTILLAHLPPADTKIDVMHDGRAIGGLAVRAAIERYRPALGLHGHVHEAPKMPAGGWRDRVGDTPVVNPGSTHHRGNAAMLHVVSFDTEDIEGTLDYRRLPAGA